MVPATDLHHRFFFHFKSLKLDYLLISERFKVLIKQSLRSFSSTEEIKLETRLFLELPCLWLFRNKDVL